MPWMIPLVALAALVVGPVVRLAVDQVPPRRPVLRRRGPEDGPALRRREMVPVASWTVPDTAATSVPVGSPDDAPDGERPRTRRPWRAPVIDLGLVAVWVLVALRFAGRADLPAFLVLGAALVAVTVIDIDHYRIPDRIVFPALAASSVLLVVAAVAGGIPGALLSGGVGALAYAGFLFLFFVISPSGMGFGDVKLALLLGLHLGWAGAVVEVDGGLAHTGTVDALRLVLMGGLFGSVLGSLAGLVAMAARGRRAHFPFGPSLCAGALAAVLLGEQLLR